MGQMNRQISLQRIVQEFERQNEKMKMVTEVMGDAIDDALEGDEEEEEETAELVNQVLDEIGIDMNSKILLSAKFLGLIGLFISTNYLSYTDGLQISDFMNSF
ncbi:hypothetical protein CsSME_00035172 [Camellia sinensis var. sinensis]